MNEKQQMVQDLRSLQETYRYDTSQLKAENERLKAELEKALQKKDYFLQDNQRLKAEVERVCDKLANSFTKEQVMPLIKLLQDSLKALCAWGPSPADVFIVNEIQSALAHAKEMGL